MLTHEITVKPSKRLLAFGTLLFLATLQVLIMFPDLSVALLTRSHHHLLFNPWWLNFVLLVTLYGLFMYQHGLLYARHSVLALRALPEGGWMVTTSTERYHATLHPSSIVTPVLSFLRFQVDINRYSQALQFKHKKEKAVVCLLMSDSVEAEEYRLLTVLARYT